MEVHTWRESGTTRSPAFLLRDLQWGSYTPPRFSHTLVETRNSQTPAPGRILPPSAPPLPPQQSRSPTLSAESATPHKVTENCNLKLQFEDDGRAEICRLMTFIQPRLLELRYAKVWVPVDALLCTLTREPNRKYLQEFFHGLP
ncbi:hypothetical protein BKA82DRAFT_4311559, partial [Pisolithus tinctorius]